MNYEIHEDSEGNVFVKNLSMVSLVSHSQSVTLSVSQSVSQSHYRRMSVLLKSESFNYVVRERG